MPFDVCGAMSQGYIGYHIQQGLSKILRQRGIDKQVVTLVTQVVVDKNDPKFQNPSKPIGPFYSKEEADKIAAEKGYTMKEDAGRGYRRVVASPLPVRIVELDAVKALEGAGFVMVTVGGGGIPVMEKAPGDYQGVAAVIDKDRASARLACDLRADMLVILTAVDKVSVNYRQPDQRDLDRITVDQARQYIAQGHFAPGSMLPKVESCIDFVEATGATALITSLERAHDALQGHTGTLIVKE
jgi:carbamate kinase